MEKVISINLLVSHKKNRELDEEHVKGLANSILINGLLDYPLVSKNEKGFYTILAGHHRIAACRYLVEEGYTAFAEVPCRVVQKDELDQELILIDSNLESKGLTAYQTMEAIGRKEEILRLKKANGIKVKGVLSEVIANSISDMNSRQVRTYLKIYKNGSAYLKDALKNDRVTVSEAEKLANLPKEEQRLALVRKRKGKKTAAYRNKDIFLAAVEQDMQEKLQTKVSIQNGNINIKYYNTDDLNRLLELLGFLEDEI